MEFGGVRRQEKPVRPTAPRAVRKGRHAHRMRPRVISASRTRDVPFACPAAAPTGGNHDNLRFFDQALRLYCPRHADCQWRRFSSVQYDGQPGNCGAEKDTL
jgi:hypothetical protein